MNRIGRRDAIALGIAMAATAALAASAMPSREAAAERAAQPLEALFPAVAGRWRFDPRAAGGVVRPAADQGRLYGIYDQVLERVYVDDLGRQVMLSVAYGAEQSPGLQVHRPEYCYAGGGFRVGARTEVVLRVAGQSLPATRLVASLPGRPEPVTYWVILGDEAEAPGASFRWRQLGSGLRGRVLDGMLVRVSTIDDDAARGHAVQLEFADALARAMTPAQRLRVLGAPPGGAAG